MSWTSPSSLPSFGEAYLYLKNNGLRRSLGKLVSAYIVGHQKWYLTREDLARYIGVPVVARGLEFRAARLDDVPAMHAFASRMSRQTLRTWCGPDYYFFITLKDGVPISYRCLSRLVHPGVIGFIQLRPDQIFMVDEFTAPEFRRRGITRQMAIAMAPLLVAHGFREVFGIHRVDNHDTIAAVRAKGIPRIGTVTRWCVLGKTSFTYERELAAAATVWDGADVWEDAAVGLDAPLAEREAA